jgi:hypothetical protein
MTREEAITAAVRKWWHLLNFEKMERDRWRWGMRGMIDRRSLFVRLVRKTFAEIA